MTIEFPIIYPNDTVIKTRQEFDDLLDTTFTVDEFMNLINADMEPSELFRIFEAVGMNMMPILNSLQSYNDVYYDDPWNDDFDWDFPSDFEDAEDVDQPY